MSDQPEFHVVSTGRSGSTLLSNMLRLHPEICSVSELLTMASPGSYRQDEVDGAGYWEVLSQPRSWTSFLYRQGIPMPEFLYDPTAGGRFNLETGVPPLLVTLLPHLSDSPEALYDEVHDFVLTMDSAPVIAQHYRLFEWLRDRLGRRIWVERSGSSLVHIRQLLMHAEDPYFVHLYRDGRDVAVSMSESPGFRIIAMQMMLRLVLGGIDPYSDADRPEGFDPPEELQPLLPEWFDLDTYMREEIPVAFFGLMWSRQVRAGIGGLAALPPGHLLNLRYENLLANPQGELRNLAAFVGLAGSPATERWSEEAAGLVRPNPSRLDSLSEQDRRELEEACAPAMALLYPDLEGVPDSKRSKASAAAPGPSSPSRRAAKASARRR